MADAMMPPNRNSTGFGRRMASSGSRFLSKTNKSLTAAAVLGIAAVIAGYFWWWMQRPPEAARLLPQSDAVVYLNLQPVRLAAGFSSLPQVKHDPDYEAFVQATGFEFERDLDEAAIAVHLGASAQPSKGAPDRKSVV